MAFAILCGENDVFIGTTYREIAILEHFRLLSSAKLEGQTAPQRTFKRDDDGGSRAMVDASSSRFN
jgi:hypothetical protein